MQELLTITTPIVSNCQAGDDSSIPNDGLVGLSWDFFPVLDMIPVGLPLEIANAN